MSSTPTIERILVATDFSDNAMVALRWAKRIARAHSASIRLVHVVDALAGTRLPLELQEEIAQRLSTLEDEVQAAGVSASSEQRSGTPWRAIIAAQEGWRADLIVVGARGHGPLPHLLIGSTADRVVRAAPVPVLTVHPKDEPPEGDVRRILIATDFSDESAVAMESALSLYGPDTSDATVILLHAWHPLMQYECGFASSVDFDVLGRSEDQAGSLVRSVASSLPDRFEVETAVRQGYPGTVVTREAEARAADLIAIGTHGRSGFARFMMGSIAERVLHHASCPVLTVRMPVPESELETRHQAGLASEPTATPT